MSENTEQHPLEGTEVEDDTLMDSTDEAGLLANDPALEERLNAFDVHHDAG